MKNPTANDLEQLDWAIRHGLLDTPITISRDLAEYLMDLTLANGSLLGELEELNKEVDRIRERYPKAWE
jgi:hypothetical protein